MEQAKTKLRNGSLSFTAFAQLRSSWLINRGLEIELHYENLPMQFTVNFSIVKTDFFL